MEDEMRSFVIEEIAAAVLVMRKFADDSACVRAVSEMGEVCSTRLAAGNKIMIAGNGGSAADSQHIAAEFVGRLTVDRCPLAAIALTTDSSILTAVGNDYGFETIFERQVRALGKEGDVLLAISTSGDSTNAIRALSAAREMDIITMGLTGMGGGRFAALCDYLACVPSTSTRHIQELHIAIAHIICGIAERAYVPSQTVEKVVAQRG
jgi:D-sedoheptulose 7-phosphate isomerase